MMKHWRAHNATGMAVATVALLVAGTATWLWTAPTAADCAAATADPGAQGLRATRVVVEPWLGPHHVYGVFIVPNRYKPNLNFVVSMTIRGFNHQVAIAARPDYRHAEAVVAPPGHYVLRGYVPTRLALWLLVTGHFQQLRYPCNWMLAVRERPT
jgi:hypothetical protein